MASNRHLGRVIVLQSLYEYELRTLAEDPEVDLDVIVAKNIEPYEKALGDTEFVYNLAHKVAENFEVLDTALAPMAPEWPIESIAAIDRNVLRMGLYELSECGDTIPPKVAINEAVELAKAFGSENSSRFVNGVLGTAYKKLGITEENNHEPTKKTSKAGGSDATGKDGGASDTQAGGAKESSSAKKPGGSKKAGGTKSGGSKSGDGKSGSVKSGSAEKASDVASADDTTAADGAEQPSDSEKPESAKAKS